MLLSQVIGAQTWKDPDFAHGPGRSFFQPWFRGHSLNEALCYVLMTRMCLRPGLPLEALRVRCRGPRQTGNSRYLFKVCRSPYVLARSSETYGVIVIRGCFVVLLNRYLGPFWVVNWEIK